MSRAREAAGTFVLSATGRALSLLTAVIMARLMGPTMFGEYAIAFSLAMVLSIPISTGIPPLIVRLVSQYQVRGEWALLAGLLRRSFAAIVTYSSATIVVVGIVLVLIGTGSPSSAMTYILALMLIPVIGLLATTSSILRGMNHVALSQLGQHAVLPLVLLAAMVAWRLSSADEMPALFAMAARIGASLAALTLLAALVVKKAPGPLKEARATFDMKGWVQSALPLVSLGGLAVVNNRLDILMLGAITGPQAAGIYQVSVRGAELVILGLGVANAITEPMVARYYATRSMAHLQRAVTLNSVYSTSFALPLTLAYWLFGANIIGLVFGDGYTGAVPALLILSSAHLVGTAIGPVGLVLTMTGHERAAVRGMGVGAITNLLLNVLLIPLWGAVGAATATATSLVAWKLTQVALARGLVGVRFPAVGGLRHGPGK